MALIDGAKRPRLEAFAEIHSQNPFLRERIRLEREALGATFRRGATVRASLDYETDENLRRLGERIEVDTEGLRGRLASGVAATEAELSLYQDLVLYLLYRRYRADLEKTHQKVDFWDRFETDCRRFLVFPGRTLPAGRDPARLLADGFQFSRALAHIFNNIVGTSTSIARLRAAVWQSIFTHDMRRYRRSLYRCMSDVTTLITGPSGTGKELVARAVAFSQYIPFDPRAREFAGRFDESFRAINLSALASTLIESELFGHRKGAFTGALEDRRGRLEECGALGSVFLDEIGELDPALQVKLLRVVQTRTFQRLGESRDVQFRGKIIAATNRDLAAEMQAERFRPDLYFRLCADRIVTPSLREQLEEAPGDLRALLLFIAGRFRGITGTEAAEIAGEAERWIAAHPVLGRGYPWPGNFRELEQCVRNVMIRREYHPAAPPGKADGDPRRALAAAVRDGALTLAELERRYCTLVYSETRDYVKAAERLRIDRRTLKSKVDPDLLGRFAGR